MFTVVDSPDVKEERKKNADVLMLTEMRQGVSENVKVDRHCSLGKLLRVTAYIQRIIENLECYRTGMKPKRGIFPLEEKERAERN